MKTLITSLLLLTLATATAQAITKEQTVETLNATVILTRAAELCPQYSFSYTKSLDYDAIMRGARILLGDKAFNAELTKNNRDISTILFGGGKEEFCTFAENLDMSISGFAK